MIAAYVLSCILLVLAFQGLRVWPRTAEMTRELRTAFGVMAAKDMSDDEKEREIQTRSIRVLGLTARLTLALIVTFAAAAAPVAIAVWADWLTWESFLIFSIQPLVIVLTVVALALWPRVQSRFARG
ncbi:hypothetical protein [Aurantiacibacter sp. D1-12]|uniref:hypothetical protein n=1 Tax=Aurantiacibacter sp. D1-12 TaxID=2993658 RepID=UPI00237C5E38|nr:hypothetical protein [Aurantiacibacter sp. D1-12]MDE1467572.1 hypothetical protein [Aurantiacibacter sp. D1-12]